MANDEVLQAEVARKIGLIFRAVITIVVLVVLAYLAIGDWVKNYYAVNDVTSLESAVQSLSDEEKATMVSNAIIYNQSLAAPETVQEQIPYEDVLNVLDGKMAWIDIPALAVVQTVSHGGSVSGLSGGAGHVEGTSVPIGGNGSHSIILVDKGIFGQRPLDEVGALSRGDKVVVHVLGQSLSYRVDTCKAIYSDEIPEDFNFDPETDQLTLMAKPDGFNDRGVIVHCLSTMDDAVSGSGDDGRIGYTSQWRLYLTSSTIPFLVVLVIAAVYWIFQLFKIRRHKKIVSRVEQEIEKDNQD